MCSAFASRTAPSSRSARGQPGSSFALVCESPLANNVTSCPSATSSSVIQCTTRSVPPYSFGGTASVSGATCAMRMMSPVGLQMAPCAASARELENAQKARRTRKLFSQSHGTFVRASSFAPTVKSRALRRLGTCVKYGALAATTLSAQPIAAKMIDRTTTSEGAGDLCGYAASPFAFIFRYVSFRTPCHAMIVAAVLAAVTCSVTTQYGVKYLVDRLASGPATSHAIWFAFAFLVGLIAADNLLWRVAGWIASFTFVRVTG